MRTMDNSRRNNCSFGCSRTAGDDSIEHEARNDSDELRVVLIFDVWNPLLSADEREMVRTISAATRDFHLQE